MAFRTKPHSACFWNVVLLAKAIKILFIDDFDGDFDFGHAMIAEHYNIAAALIKHLLDPVLLQLVTKALFPENSC